MIKERFEVEEEEGGGGLICRQCTSEVSELLDGLCHICRKGEKYAGQSMGNNNDNNTRNISNLFGSGSRGCSMWKG